MKNFFNFKLYMFMQKHSFHLVDLSPWPFLISVSIFSGTVSLLNFFHGYKNDISIIWNFILLSFILFTWWRDLVRESTLGGYHTSLVQKSLRFGMFLFIISEICFFFAFFWAFFHNSLSPSIEVGGIWPPKGILFFNPWFIPLVNTLILLLSGCAVTWAHHAILSGNKNEVLKGLQWTIFLAFLFSFFQYLEYIQAEFRFSDSCYGSIFFLTTGFHGVHVIIGTIFLISCFVRFLNFHFTIEHHFGFESAIWYWHFVDIVWLFLFISIYWWGTLKFA
uniref:cytochrome c oxidase subunit 3 n=1 Tax=Neorhodella cyanea TaxID=131155 RepID=UPI001FCE0215|nr:cytochrome c oxidase subunit 3 [Neorhodella cyanea]UNJ18808.1 cytochrome c oxidase subunit 3 [Neorhodella cyanea]